MRISDWSSDVCSSDLVVITGAAGFLGQRLTTQLLAAGQLTDRDGRIRAIDQLVLADIVAAPDPGDARVRVVTGDLGRSEGRRGGKECVSTGRSRWSPLH